MVYGSSAAVIDKPVGELDWKGAIPLLPATDLLLTKEHHSNLELDYSLAGMIKIGGCLWVFTSFCPFNGTGREM
jgi:hypothetical protein